MRTASVCTGKVRIPFPACSRETRDLNDFNSLTNPTEADEAYVIGKRGQYTPVGAYLAGDEIIKIALEHGANMIHPGSSSLACIKNMSFEAES